MNTISVLLAYALVGGILLIGFDLVLTGAPAVRAWYRRTLSATGRFLGRTLAGLANWAWRHYRQFIIGLAVGAFAALYFTGYLH